MLHSYDIELKTDEPSGATRDRRRNPVAFAETDPVPSASAPPSMPPAYVGTA
jgi:hypothetical protein